jgi:mono/diheme cytochrome c family protein
MQNGGNMRRIFLRPAPAAIFICFAALALPAGLRAQSDADKVYKKNCVLCHAADGSGSSPSGKALKAKDLASAEVQKKTDEELAEIVIGGKGKMPAFGTKIKPEQIRQLIAYIRALPKK